jgi:ribonuclease PH
MNPLQIISKTTTRTVIASGAKQSHKTFLEKQGQRLLTRTGRAVPVSSKKTPYSQHLHLL